MRVMSGAVSFPWHLYSKLILKVNVEVSCFRFDEMIKILLDGL